MRVYRVARLTERTPYPVGPYQSSNLDRTTTEILYDMYDVHWGTYHPTPDGEGFYMRESHLCAFSSEWQLYSWFDGWEMHLDVCDFRIFVYDVPETAVWELEYQTIIDRNFMTYVTDYALSY